LCATEDEVHAVIPGSASAVENWPYPFRSSARVWIERVADCLYRPQSLARSRKVDNL
jgi:hypothetical protein